LGHRLADGLEGSEVHDGVEGVRREQRVHRRVVADVGTHESGLAAADCLEPPQHRRRAVAEVVDADDLEARVPQGEPGVGTDIACGPGQQDALVGHG
jgi:hypothetical protein